MGTKRGKVDRVGRKKEVKKMQEKLKLKWLNKLQDIQLISEIERQRSHLAEYLNRADRMKSSDYIRYTYAYINTCKVILKSRKVNA